MPDPAVFPPPPARRAVVVLGMHRSGTSAVAGCLHRLGVDFGPRLMPPTEDNARGYFEHVDIVNLHDRFLLALGGSWDETRPFLPRSWPANDERADAYRAELLDLLRRDLPAAPLWGLKDPRLCRLLPWWEPVWAETNTRPLFIIVRRHPAEVAASLARREGFSTVKSHMLWLLHMLDAERSTRGHQRVIVDFEQFLADWRSALEPVRAALGQPWPHPTATSFIDPALVRSVSGGESASLPRWLARADAAIQAGEAETVAAFDVLADEVGAAQELYGIADAGRSADLSQQLEATRRQARWYEAEWHKARRRTEKIQARLEAKSAQLHQAKFKKLINNKDKSILINDKISILRILWGKLRRIR